MCAKKKQKTPFLRHSSGKEAEAKEDRFLTLICVLVLVSRLFYLTLMTSCFAFGGQASYVEWCGVAALFP